MNFPEWYKVFQTKVKKYDLEMCRHALTDCHEVLNVWGETIDKAYADKIWAEIDAIRDRQLKITRAS